MSNILNQYLEDGNSDELSRKFHDRAVLISRELSKQLLTLSTGIIAAFFFLVFNKVGFQPLEKFFIFITIVSFGLSILFIIMGMQWEASKNYYLGNINDSTKQKSEVRERNEILKRQYNKWQLNAKSCVRIFFLLGMLFAISFFTIHLFLFVK